MQMHRKLFKPGFNYIAQERGSSGKENVLKDTIHVWRVNYLSCVCAILRLCVTFQNDEIFENAKAMNQKTG